MEFFPVLEGLRGVASILVMFRHIGKLSPMQAETSYLAVDLFFLLSGVVIAKSYEQKLLLNKISFSLFVKRRIIRIFPLYLIGSAIGALALYLYGVQTLQVIGLIGLAAFMLPNFIFLAPLYPFNIPAWSLFFEFFVNFFYAKVIKRLSNKMLLLVLVISFGCLAFGVQKYKGLDIGWFSGNFWLGFPRVCFSFFYGVLIYRYFSKHQKINFRFNGLVSAFILLIAVLTEVLSVPKKAVPAFDLVVILIIAPALVTCALHVSIVGWGRKILLILGDISFPLYVLHAPLFMISSVVFGTALDHHLILSKILFCLSAIVIAMLAYYWIDIPLRRKFNGYTLALKAQ